MVARALPEVGEQLVVRKRIRIDGLQLTVRGDFAGLQGAATVAHLLLGPVMGVRGPSFADVAVPAATSGQFTATVALTEEQVEALRGGRIYLQIHSATAPDGNLWGWLIP